MVKRTVVIVVGMMVVAGMGLSGCQPKVTIPDDQQKLIKNDYDKGVYLQGQADEYAQKDKQKRAKMYYEAAIEAYAAFRAERPKSPLAPMANLRRGESLEATGDYIGALAAYQTIIDETPTSPARLFADEKIKAVKLKAKKQKAEMEQKRKEEEAKRKAEAEKKAAEEEAKKKAEEEKAKKAEGSGKKGEGSDKKK